MRADAQRTNPQVKTGDEVEDMPFMEKMPGGGVLHGLIFPGATQNAVPMYRRCACARG